MSRGRSERKPHGGNQIDHFGRRGDPFQEMHQVMKSFGGFGFGNDDFFGSGSLMRRFQDPFKQMMQFSNAHKGLHSSGKEGSYVCQTFVSSSTMGRDGKVKQQSYFENSAGQNKNGQTISQKHQAYQNNDGIKRIAEQRMLNNQGRKMIKQKRGNNIQQTNHYYNIQEQEASRFDQDWKGINNELKFLQNHEKYMQSINSNQGYNQRQLGLGYEPRRQEYKKPNQKREQYRPINHQPQQNFNRQPSSHSDNQSRSNYSNKGSSKNGSRAFN